MGPAPGPGRGQGPGPGPFPHWGGDLSKNTPWGEGGKSACLMLKTTYLI